MVILYSTNCPKCKIIKQKLSQANLEFTEITDVKKIMEKGFREAPVLEVDGEFMKFPEAVAWLRGKLDNAD